MKTSIRKPILILIVSSMTACGSDMKSSSSPSESPELDGQTASCKQWYSNSDYQAVQLLSWLHPGGITSVSSNQLNLSYSGQLNSYVPDGLEYSAAALYSRPGLLSEFELTFRFDGIASSHSDLASFVSFQNEFTGFRLTFVDMGDKYTVIKSTWNIYGNFHTDNDEELMGWTKELLPITYTFKRDANGILKWEVRNKAGQVSGTGSYSGIGWDLYLGFGIKNRSVSGSAVSGSITSTFSNLKLFTPDGSCDAQGF